MFNRSVISDYLDKEVQLGRVVGPLSGDTAVHISRFGVVPKSSQPGKWRLIIDLSAPENHSVNDGIAPGVLLLVVHQSIAPLSWCIAGVGALCWQN